MRFKLWTGMTFLFALWFSSAAHAQSAPDVGTMFANFSETSVALIALSKVVAVAAGVFFLILTLIRVREHAEGGGRNGTKVSGIIILFFVSIFLIVIPTTLNIGTNTMSLGNASSQFSTSGGGGGGSYSSAIQGVILFIQLVGHVGFIRGLFILKGMGEGDRQATFGRAVIFLIGGAMAINIQITVALLANTIAPGMTLPSGLGGL